MDTESKLDLLVAAAQFDVCGCGGGCRPSSSSAKRYIYHAALPGGGSVPLFKVLLTNVCVNDCAYCINQVGRDIPRSSFQPEELSKLFMELHRKNLVQGLFLSSAIAGNASRTTESMLKTVELLRKRYRFDGYIHLKILPGASFDYVEQGCKLATRVSVNIEAPTSRHLAKLSSKKDIFQGILEPMRWVRQLTLRNDTLVPSGQTTQFVVGAAGETDREILSTTEALYKDVKLRRAYFSAFQPISRSRLEGLSPTPPMREHRLYEADWLLRVYGFSPQELELAIGKSGNLPLSKDPKMAIAQGQSWLFPMDVNRATYDELLRVPGIGPLSAKRIVEARKDHSIDSVEQLRKMRVVMKRAEPFIWFKSMLPSEKQSTFLPQLDDEMSQEPSLAGVI